MNSKENRESFSKDNVITDKILDIVADIIQTEDEMDILIHEKRAIDIPSEFDEKMIEFARHLDSERKELTKRKQMKRFFRIVAIFLICIISAGSITMVTSEAFRKKVFSFFNNSKEGSVMLRTGDEEDLIGHWENFWYPTFLPKNFSLIAVEESDHFMLYFNAEQNLELRIFEQNMDSALTIDTDSTVGERIEINSNDGYFFELDSMNGFGITWRTEGASMMMCFEGEWEKQEIVEIAENVKYIEKF